MLYFFLYLSRWNLFMGFNTRIFFLSLKRSQHIRCSTTIETHKKPGTIVIINFTSIDDTHKMLPYEFSNKLWFFRQELQKDIENFEMRKNKFFHKFCNSSTFKYHYFTEIFEVFPFSPLMKPIENESMQRLTNVIATIRAKSPIMLLLTPISAHKQNPWQKHRLSLIIVIKL